MTRFYHSFKLPYRSISVSQHLLNFFRLTLFALVVIFMNSCEEGPTKIGNDLLPNQDFVTIKSTDTLSIRSYTMFDASVRTDKPYYGYLGQVYDPYFGTTTTEFVSQIRMGKPWDDLPFTIDSVKLYLKLLTVTGGSGVTHTLRLSEIADQIYPDSAYYSGSPIQLTGYEVNDIVLPQLRPDTVNDIVVTLPISFGSYLTSDTAQLFYNNNKPDFRSFFKGLSFQISSGTDPLLVSLYLESPSLNNTLHTTSQNYFVLYMHDADNVFKTFLFILDATNKNASFNRFLHDFNTASPGKIIDHINDTIFRDTLSYLQSLNGVYTKIKFPGLESLKNDPSFGRVAVNKARLTVPVYIDRTIYNASSFPSNLRLRYKSSNGDKYDVPDYFLDQYHAFFDGKLDSTANVYNFNIATFIQGYLDDTKNSFNPELEIFQDPTGTKNAIFKANSSKTPIKLELTYTKF